MTEAVREKLSKATRKTNRNRVENGTHHFLGPETNRKRIEEGTHNFLDSDAARKNNLKRVENGTHHFLDSDAARKNNLKRVENGTHNLQIKGMMTALNIETGEVHSIPKELYYSRKDIYFVPNSKVFKEWKKNYSQTKIT